MYCPSCLWGLHSSSSDTHKICFNLSAEANYAFKLGKPIIPIKVDKDYDADGWLGLCTSMIMYIKAYDDDVLDKGMPSLLRELGNKGRMV